MLTIPEEVASNQWLDFLWMTIITRCGPSRNLIDRTLKPIVDIVRYRSSTTLWRCTQIRTRSYQAKPTFWRNLSIYDHKWTGSIRLWRRRWGWRQYFIFKYQTITGSCIASTKRMDRISLEEMPSSWSMKVLRRYWKCQDTTNTNSIIGRVALSRVRLKSAQWTDHPGRRSSRSLEEYSSRISPLPSQQTNNCDVPCHPNVLLINNKNIVKSFVDVNQWSIVVSRLLSW